MKKGEERCLRLGSTPLSYGKLLRDGEDDEKMAALA
jgi:hypothetical protein